MVRALPGALLLFALGCRAPARPSPPHAPATSRIVVHSDLATPVEIAIRQGVGIDGLSAAMGGVAARPAKFAPLAAFPTELECPMRSLCIVAVRKRVVALVFAFDPVVEIDVTPAPGERYALAEYRDADSESAALGSILATTSALAQACARADTRTIGKLRTALARRARRERRPIVRDAARLALVDAHCGTKPDVELARSVLAIDPTSPALGLWTSAVWRASEQLGHPQRAITAIDAMIARNPDPDVGAFLLATRAMDAQVHGDDTGAAGLDARLFAAPFAATPSAQSRRFFALVTDPLRVQPGDAVPAISLRPLDGAAAIATDDRSSAQLLYFSASWCRGCIESLPKLRRFAQAHPDVRIVYVLWDALDDAQAFVRNHDPVPGTVVRADRESRPALESAFMKLTVLPTFVLADRDGRVITTSTQHSIAELDDVLRD
ncbi:MAG TPA: thioredoxin family protein [Nannocystaceae bacterium]|nr:thioredoxin family protein [Nannocystaceae bacterium]